MKFPPRPAVSRKRVAGCVLLGFVTLALQSCGKSHSPAPGQAAGTNASASYDPTLLRRGNGPEPDTLDPQLARTDAAFNILRDLFEGLTSVGPDGSASKPGSQGCVQMPEKSGIDSALTLCPMGNVTNAAASAIA